MSADLDRLAADLDRVTAKAHFGIIAATKVAAKAAETQARQNASGRKTLPHYPRSITSEVTVVGIVGDASVVTAKVGPEVGGQGSLGHIIEHGSSGSRPHMDVHQAVDGELDGWVKALGAVGGGLL